MQEAVDGFLAAPIWAQATLALMALALVAAIVGPRIEQRRARDRFAALAEAMGAHVSPGPDVFTASFAAEAGGRSFAVRRELRSAPRGSSYRGPRGHVVVSETPLSERWQMHNIDVSRRKSVGRLGATPLASGDASFDHRFTVLQDGLPVRERWLDAPTRAAFTSFFDLPSVKGQGTVWAQEGRLQYITDTPQALDRTALRAILEQQATLASALDRTAAAR